MRQAEAELRPIPAEGLVRAMEGHELGHTEHHLALGHEELVDDEVGVSQDGDGVDGVADALDLEAGEVAFGIVDAEGVVDAVVAALGKAIWVAGLGEDDRGPHGYNKKKVGKGWC